MKRLRYGCPFYGYGMEVAYLCILLWVVTLLWCVLSDANLPLWVSLLPSVGCALAAYLWLHRLREEERVWIADAPPLLWQPATAADCVAVQHASMQSRAFCVWMLLLGGVLVAGLFYLRADAVLTCVFSLTMVVCIGTVVCAYLRARLWQELDETALAARIPVQHFFMRVQFMGGDRLPRLTRTYEGYYAQKRGRKVSKQYLVCYLPDGKYVLYQDPPAVNPQWIRVVQYRGQIRWYLEA